MCNILLIITTLLLVECRSGPIGTDQTGDQSLPLSVRQVNTKYGALRGVYMTFPMPSSHSSHPAISLSPVEAYLGVPYATPPVGSLRFMPPVTPTHWRGTRLANRLSAVCPQRIPHWRLIMTNSTEALKRMPLQRFEYMRRLIPQLNNQSEDCLYLNIYAPAVDRSQESSDSDTGKSSF